MYHQGQGFQAQGGFRGGGRGGGGTHSDVNKPWITPGLKQEIYKKQGLAAAAKRAKSAETAAALQEQQERLDGLLQEAKVITGQDLVILTPP